MTGAGRGAGVAGAGLGARAPAGTGAAAAEGLPPEEVPPEEVPPEEVPPELPVVAGRWMMITTWRCGGTVAGGAATVAVGVAVAGDAGAPTVNAVTRPTSAAALNPRARTRDAAAG